MPKPGEGLKKEKVIETILAKHDAATGDRKFNASTAAKVDEALEQLESTRSREQAHADALRRAETTVHSLEKAALATCVSYARNRGRLIRIAIAFVVSCVLGGVGIVANYLSPLFPNFKWLIDALVAVATIILTFIIAWTVPDILFKDWVAAQVQAEFDRQALRLGATTYLAHWEVDLETGAVNPKR